MNVITLINLTPHEVTLVREDGVTFSYPPSGVVARVVIENHTIGTLDGAPVRRGVTTSITGIPTYKKNVKYIVSHRVLQTARRHDLVAPDTGPDSAVRDGAGNIKAVRGWRRV